MPGNKHVLQDRPDASYGAGSYPVASLTRADKIYLFQASLMVPNLHAQVLSGSRLEIKDVINAVGSGSGPVNGEAGINPSDDTQDVSAQVTPAFKAVVDAAVAASPARRGRIVGHPGLSDAQIALRQQHQHK